ncbi:hypothetical protein WI560_23630 [Bradyrhizobium sp. A11]|uniref:hypothetical protein n=1 Tax=Bradyrhizobium sp. A11 TaxID=3133974 RepID=UPI003247AB8D
MATTTDILRNAERLIADAELLFSQGSARSAATLIVHALEQMGEFVEALTLEKYPNAEVRMGLFNQPNRHAKRQDALVAHVLNFAIAQTAASFYAEKYAHEHGAITDDGHYLDWFSRNSSLALSEEQQQRWLQSPHLTTAHLLLHLARTGVLKGLREYGFYENTDRAFSENEVHHVLELASQVRAILENPFVASEPPGMAGVNMPEGLTIDEWKQRKGD